MPQLFHEETSKLLALVTRRGIMLPRCLYFGPKQGPGIFQSFVDSVFNRVVGDEGEEGDVDQEAEEIAEGMSELVRGVTTWATHTRLSAVVPICP